MFRELVGGMIARSGGEVETVDGSVLEYIAPGPVREQLRIPEFGRLNFGPDAIRGAERVSFESDWIERLENLAADRGKYGEAVVNLDFPAISDPARILEHGVMLHNAVYRMTESFRARTRYLLLAFRYTAVSDEKRMGIVQVLLNLETGSAPDEVIKPIRLAVLELGQVEPGASGRFYSAPSPWGADRIAKTLRGAMPARLLRDLSPFIGGMQRRLDRDQSRLVDYYEGLRQEAIKRSIKKGGDPERERLRVDTIVHEYRAKVSDLRQKYALVIDVNLLQLIEIVMPVWRFVLTIKRRKGERRVSLDWNPLARKLEPLPCEYSFTSEATRVVCDDALHILSPAGLAPCEGCGKEFCRVCYPRACPKCRHAVNQELGVQSYSLDTCSLDT